MLANCRVVLVRPHYPGNLGATARVMRTFGLADLVLVAPVASVNDLEARRLATHGLAILDRARTVPDLGDAVADCTRVLATSAKTAGLFRGQVQGTPAELLPAFADALTTAPAALVFGPEPHGLTTAEIARCHGLVHVPTAAEFPALNLAQAVAICLYELFLASGGRQPPVDVPEPNNRGLTPPARQHAVAPFADQERMFDHLRRGLEAVHFLYGQNADALMAAVRHLIGRANPTPGEVKILHGLARQLEYEGRSKKHDPPNPV